MLKNKVETELTKEENDYYKFLFFGFFSIILLFSLLLVFIPKKEISVTEKRTLEKFPKIELEALSSGTYYNNLEKYFSDHFIFREFLIKFNNNKNYFLGKRKINSTYIGKFRKSLYEEFKPDCEENLIKKIEVINQIRKTYPWAEFYTVFVPTSTISRRENLPYFADIYDENKNFSVIRNYLREDIFLVDLFKDFFQKDSNLYYKTDHHLTSEGAYKAYLKLKEFYPFETKDAKYEKKLVANDFRGSLYSKVVGILNIYDEIHIYKPEEEIPVLVNYVAEKKKTTSLYNIENLKKDDKYTFFTNGNHAEIDIKTTVHNGKKLLVIKDSYANSMLPFLINDFQEIKVLDLRYFTGSVKEILDTTEYKHVLILYGISTLNSDNSILNLKD